MKNMTKSFKRMIILLILLISSIVIILECFPTDDCTSNENCAVDEYCKKDADDCDGKGKCETKASGCPEILAPVCGCDGNIYENDCFAAEAGVNVAYDGECNSTSVPCFLDGECSSDEYCAKEVGDCDGQGECNSKPDACYDVWSPVCGCDGKTYGNDCEAAANGISIDYEGECITDYCWDNEMCGENNYCFFADCAQETGTCQPKPEICTAHWDPVCGCDGKTYGNACEAAANGISVDYKEECKIDECCFDSCGDGVCDQLMCITCECPCFETLDSCPQDCSSKKIVCCESFGFGSDMVKCCETYEWTLIDKCTVPEEWVGGGKQIVDDSYCTCVDKME